MEELMKKLAEIAKDVKMAPAVSNKSSCSGCCWGGSCCSNPVSG